MASKSIRWSRPRLSATMFSGFRSPCAQSSAVSAAAMRSNAAANLLSRAVSPASAGCGDRFVKRHAFDPVAQHHIHPDAACGRGVDEKLLRQQLLAVDFRQMARMVHVTAQRADAAFAADAEYDGAVACRVAYAPLSVAAHLDLAQRPGEAVRIGQRGQVLAQCEHGFTDCVSCCRG